MENLQRLIDAYRMADSRRRLEAVTRLERIAKAHPGAVPAAKRVGLSLVVDNTLLVDAPEIPSGVHDLSSAVGVCFVI